MNFRNFTEKLGFRRERKNLSNELEKQLASLEKTGPLLGPQQQEMTWEAMDADNSNFAKHGSPYAEADIGLPGAADKINAYPNFKQTVKALEMQISAAANSNLQEADTRYILLASAWEEFKTAHKSALLPTIPTKIRDFLKEIQKMETF